MATTGGLVCGASAAYVWHAVTSRSDTRALFAALGRSVRAMLSDDGQFFREYGRLLVCVGSFVLWNLLALAGAVAPLLVLWPLFPESHVTLVVVYSLASMAGVLWLRARAKNMDSSAGASGLSVSDSQFFFLQVIESAPGILRKVAGLETRFLHKRLEATPVDRPVFVTGLARAGTTMLLELLAQADGVATHRYRDFPFLSTPYFWSRFVNLFGGKGKLVQRPHQDGIKITPESPEAFEEPIWQSYFPEAHRSAASHVLDDTVENEPFDAFFRDHLKKMLLIRDGSRYVSKGNYNVTRIEYLAKLFPDARFVVPIRHPLAHVASLVRQHEIFCEYAAHDARVPHYLESAGHFEFGPQRVPVSVEGSGERTQAAWDAGEEHLGYAIQWAAIYGYIGELLQRSPEFAERVLLVRYEDICENPTGEITQVLEHTELRDEGAALLEKLDHIGRPVVYKNIDDATTNAVWDATRTVAEQFGYDLAGHR